MPLPRVSLPALLLVSGLCAASVLPPTNVTVSCANFRVTVSWEYGNQQPQTSFHVTVRGATGQFTWRTTDHHCELTAFIWTAEKYYMDNFYATVTAVLGSNESEPVQTKTFTFNKVKTTDVVCELDFPPVALSVMDSGATVKVENPFLYYRELRAAVTPDDASFRFSVSTDRGDEEFGCTVKEENCKHEIKSASGVECVTLKGRLFDRIGVGQVWFRETGRVCSSNSAEVHVVALVVLLSITALIVSAISVAVCRVKAWTMKMPESLPVSLQPDCRKQEPSYGPESHTDISAVRLVAPPGEKPSVGPEEEQDPCEDPWHSRAEGRSQRSSTELEAAGLMPEGPGTEDDSAQCVGSCVEEGEKEQSHYDHGHVRREDMGDGDMVVVYMGR